MEDTFYMKRVLELAQKGLGLTSPNPVVGTVLVKDGKVIGEGFHENYGGKHAEVAAIENASQTVKNATLYCNLEPCVNGIPNKKTPPCTDRIIQEQIGRVVLASKDPNPHVNGRGIKKLQEHGIEVKTGILQPEAALLNEKYYKFIQTGYPFVHLKIAQSLDGRIATSSGNSQWITNQTALKRVHKMRSQYDAVMVGANTAVKDDPSLTVRLIPGRNPYRIVLDNDLIIPDGAKLISDGIQDKTIIFTVMAQNHPRVRELLKRELQVITVQPDESGFVNLIEVLERLANLKIASVLVEGGASIFTSFVQKRLFDKISIFIAPTIIGEGIQSINDLGITSLSDALRLQKTDIEILDHQALVEGYRDFKAIFGHQPEEF